ncbi:hypothetical protein PE067_15050 [Paracoccus sp. DMF-8]|uniref:hypothetical protein n=1 Tax=Paracoccus sp. DMF-8 TaxID=3019445 RepID=UPI0023E42E0E|nr:hypothetical protein [Paracoccus sp. DMF-8]MDF3607335.1 hypothetical protein [Paracoccus sp. DMF-8]
MFVNDTDLDRAFDEIFDIRRQIVDALQSDFAAPEDFGPECRMIYVGSYSEDDTVGLRQAKAVEQIKKKLRLFVRYEASEA